MTRVRVPVRSHDCAFLFCTFFVLLSELTLALFRFTELTLALFWFTERRNSILLLSGKCYSERFSTISIPVSGKSSFDCLLCVIKKILNLCVNSYIHRWNYARSKIHTHRNIHALCPPHRGAGSMHRSRVVCRSGWGAAAAKGTRGAEAAACC